MLPPFQGLAPDNQHEVPPKHISLVLDKDHGLKGVVEHQWLLLYALLGFLQMQ